MAGVLFLQSQVFAGADTMMHAQLLRYLDRRRYTLHVACNVADDPRAASSAYAVMRALPDVATLRVPFGPSLEGTAGARRLLLARQAPALAGGLATLARYVRRHNIRLIHCTEKPRDAVVALALARLTGAACVIHLHVKYERWLNPAVRTALRRADAVIGVSEFVRRSAIAAGGVRPDRAFAVVNGLDLDRWDAAADPAGAATMRREFGVPDGVPVIGIAARLFVWKGHLELLRALAPLARQGRDFRLLIVGEDDLRGAPDRPPFSQELRRATGALDLEDRVIFTGWRQDMQRVMAAFDIYAMPSFEEPLGVVYLEAMATRRPVVALRSGGVPEVVEHERSGLLSEPGDEAALTANLARLLDDPALRRRMGEAGRLAVEGRLSAPAMARRVEDVYAQILTRRDRRAPLADASQPAL